MVWHVAQSVPERAVVLVLVAGLAGLVRDAFELRPPGDRGVAARTIDAEVPAGEREIGAGVGEVGRGLPRLRVVAGRAVLPSELGAVRAVGAVAGRARGLGVSKLDRPARRLPVARGAGETDVLTNEREPGRRVVEVADLLPGARVVAGLAIDAEIRPVWVLAAVARGAVVGEAEVRLVEATGRELERAHIGGGDELGLMAASAVCARVFAEEWVAGLAVVERVGVEAGGVEVAAEVVFVARPAVAVGGGVEAFVAADPGPQRGVAGEALLRLDAALPEGVAVRTAGEPFEAGVRRRQLARRDELRLRRQGEQGEQEHERCTHRPFMRGTAVWATSRHLLRDRETAHGVRNDRLVQRLRRVGISTRRARGRAAGTRPCARRGRAGGHAGELGEGGLGLRRERSVGAVADGGPPPAGLVGAALIRVDSAEVVHRRRVVRVVLQHRLGGAQRVVPSPSPARTLARSSQTWWLRGWRARKRS